LSVGGFLRPPEARIRSIGQKTAERLAVDVRHVPELDVEASPDAGQRRGEVLQRHVELLLELKEEPGHAEAALGEVLGAQGIALVHRQLQVHPRAVSEFCSYRCQDGDGHHHQEQSHASLLLSLGGHQNLGISVLSMTRVSVVYRCS
jgi:hypothetical protein